MATTQQQKLVGPVVRGMASDIAEALYEAIEHDNPGVEVLYEDHGGYIRIHTPQHCRVTRASLETALDRPFRLTDLEPSLSSFAGRMKYNGDNEIIWYLERED